MVTQCFQLGNTCVLDIRFSEPNCQKWNYDCKWAGSILLYRLWDIHILLLKTTTKGECLQYWTKACKHEKHYTTSYHETQTTCENVSAAVSYMTALWQKSSHSQAMVQCVKTFTPLIYFSIFQRINRKKMLGWYTLWPWRDINISNIFYNPSLHSYSLCHDRVTSVTTGHICHLPEVLLCHSFTAFAILHKCIIHTGHMTHTHTHTQRNIDTHTHTHRNIDRHTPIHTKHTCVRTHAHTHTHTHTHTQFCITCKVSWFTDLRKLHATLSTLFKWYNLLASVPTST
jgi:hypothetical protein